MERTFNLVAFADVGFPFYSMSSSFSGIPPLPSAYPSPFLHPLHPANSLILPPLHSTPLPISASPLPVVKPIYADQIEAYFAHYKIELTWKVINGGEIHKNMEVSRTSV